jgi:hypothetical protein
VRSSTVPSSHVQNGVCEVAGDTPDPTGRQPLVVAPRPTGVTVIWLPGLDSKSCTAATSHGGAGTAVRLARAIDHARTISAHAVFNCPNDDGTAAWLTFSYAGHKSSARIDLSLSGCRFMNAPGTLRRSMSVGVSTALSSLAPCPWATYVGYTTAACLAPGPGPGPAQP